MQFDFNIRLKDGRTVNVIGEAEVTPRCDCSGDSHNHIDAIEIESATLQVHDADWLEIECTPLVMSELEYKVESKLYAELEDAA